MFRQSQSTYTTTRSGNSARHLLTSSHKALNQHFQQLSLGEFNFHPDESLEVKQSDLQMEQALSDSSVNVTDLHMLLSNNVNLTPEEQCCPTFPVLGGDLGIKTYTVSVYGPVKAAAATKTGRYKGINFDGCLSVFPTVCGHSLLNSTLSIQTFRTPCNHTSVHSGQQEALWSPGPGRPVTIPGCRW
ncbi:hypothetical protein DPMN_185956 [Dreissena polymorpha]|uniref:Uncharacterized protein n=1 Tax=Dreissena polymorpha TaxID=45954 RepID=A0A9D4DN86_DREPO|nr:hypothetical protein DPMN_185956 [Dreissena polymorpha]